MTEYLFIGSATLSLVNGSVLLWINPRRIVNRVFFAASLCNTAWYGCVIMAKLEGSKRSLDLEELLFWLRASSVVGAFYIWFLWLMKSVLLQDRDKLRDILIRSWPWFCMSCFSAGLASSESFISSEFTPEKTVRGAGYIIYALVTGICGIWLLIDSLRHVSLLKGARRIEMQFFVVSAICGCLLVVFCNAAGLALDMPWLKQTSAVWFTMAHGITVWSVCYYRVFDAKQLLVSIGQRLLLLSFLGFSAVVLNQNLSTTIPGGLRVFFTVLGTCVFAILCDKPIRRWLGLDRDHILLLPRRKIIEWSRALPDEEQLKTNFEGLLREWCQTNSVSLVAVREQSRPSLHPSLPADWLGLTPVLKDGWITPEALQRSKPSIGTAECAAYMRTHDIGALLAVPRGDISPSLLISFGQKESLRPYTYPDIQVLLELAELMDNILTHSRASAHVARMEKMDAAAMMSRGLAHDLSNLATPVSTFLVHMESRVATGSLEATVLADAKHSVGVMQKYIQESLFFTKTLVPKIESIEASQVLSSVSRLCHDRAKAHGASIVVQTDDALTFFADSALIKRLLQNLVLNAVDASPNGGEIYLRARHTDGEHVAFEVEDHGTGISPDIINRIFEPYFTTKPAGSTLRGLGLGLAICQKIVDLHKGTISVTSNQQAGTVFKVVLPLTAEHSPRTPGTEAAETSAGTINLRQEPQPI